MKTEERLLNKEVTPTEEEIKNFIGEKSWTLLLETESRLKENYDLNKELRFPFGNNYGWGYRYRHKASHLFYLFFQKGGFVCTTQLGDKTVEKVEKLLPETLEKTQELWKTRYPCGEQGGWINYFIETREELCDFLKLLNIKVRPKKTRAINRS